MNRIINDPMRDVLERRPSGSATPRLPAELEADLQRGIVARDGCVVLAALDAGGEVADFFDRTDLEASVNDITLWSGADDQPWDEPTLAAVGVEVLDRLGSLVRAMADAMTVRLVLSIDAPFANVRMFCLRDDEAPWIDDVGALSAPALIEDVVSPG